ncbi:MAG: 3-dehydroquinate synthase [wastewater metagenome]|nr:3-dehydroquinate synthase [Candidatus Loosdrechtia aerotolerans]
MKTVRVNLPVNGYNIFIDRDFLSRIGEILSKEVKVKPCRALIITDRNAGGIFGDVVTDSLLRHNFDVRVVSIDPGEGQKTLKTASTFYDACFEHKLDRGSLIVALGGGVIGDISGFVAATFMRGIPFVQVPTTLLAQVDSSVGGKVAVNHPKGKNMIGNFYQPKAVFIDIDTLSTLPKEELIAGLAEVIKYGVIRDRELFEYLENFLPDILHLATSALERIVEASCQIKADIVEKDETEKNLRAVLNYGHTIGHAIESLTHYKEFRHGEAVAIGMLYASQIAIELGMCDNDVFERQLLLIRQLGLSLHSGLRPEDIIRTLYLDKKALDGRLRFILPVSIGEVVISDKVTEEILHRVLHKPL